MKFLVITQDLRVSGTSEGVVSRSFIAKLRGAYPEAIIDVVYLKHHSNDDQLYLLPVDSIQTYLVDLSVPSSIKWINKIYWRVFNRSLNERNIQKKYAFHIAQIDYKKYDHIFIRSSGLEYESILGAKDLPVLKEAIINFHDPYPIFWCAGFEKQLNKLELFRLKEMYKVVKQAKKCMSPAQTLSNDMEMLYGSKKKFYTLPHQFSPSVFDLSDESRVRKKVQKIIISYHGALQFGRCIDCLLEAYQELLGSNIYYQENTEFVLRLKGKHTQRLKEKFSKCENIFFSDLLNFSNSSIEQATEADILVIIENGSIYSNILVGKAPFIASLNKPLLSLSPERSEMRRLIQDEQYIANHDDKNEIKIKLEKLIESRLKSNDSVYPFGDYFSDENFKKQLDKILFEVQ